MEQYSFQKIGTEFLVGRKRALIASEPGLGKTCQLIVAANKITTTCSNILVVCPKSLILNWQAEIKMWGGVGNYTVINHDKLISKAYQTELLAVKWSIIIADESHTFIKTEKTQRCEFFVKLVELNREAIVWLSTATPATNSAADYYVTLKILLGSTEKLGKLNQFRENFCQKIPNPFSPKGFDYRGFKNTEILKKAFSKLAVKHRKKEVLPDLPDKTHSKLWVEVDTCMVGEIADIDSRVVEMLIERGDPLPAHVATAARAIGRSKLESCCEWIDAFPADEPLVIMVWHKELGYEVAKCCGTEAIINGDTPPDKRNLFVQQFQSGQSKRIVCNIAAGGVGINLQTASNLIFLELPWSPAHLMQAQDRVHRIGTKNAVNIYYMLAKGTIDEVIFGALMNKLEGIKQVGV